MLKALGSRLTYANVMATVAVFLALGGGAYALSGIPDRSGIFHGCMAPKTGALRVVKAASSCRKTKIVRRGRRRVRIPGESAILWSQTGPRGLQGTQGVQGIQGSPGLSGYQQVEGTATPFDTTQEKHVDITCPAGKKLLALGVQNIVHDGTLPAIIAQFNGGAGPGGDTSGTVRAQKYDGMAYSIDPEAICANVTG